MTLPPAAVRVSPVAVTPVAGERLKAMLVSNDTNKDGKVSKSEYVDHAMVRFTKIDTDKDGILSQDELKAAGVRMAARVRPTTGAPRGLRVPLAVDLGWGWPDIRG